ncbi:WD repeat-containing protein 89, partial [Operophtera brumata]
MDVSCNGRVLCAGSQVVEDDPYLVFWDQRNTQPLGGYWNSQTEDITQPSEDDALSYSLNVQNSVERLSWLSATRVACVSQCSD